MFLPVEHSLRVIEGPLTIDVPSNNNMLPLPLLMGNEATRQLSSKYTKAWENNYPLKLQKRLVERKAKAAAYECQLINTSMVKTARPLLRTFNTTKGKHDLQ